MVEERPFQLTTVQGNIAKPSSLTWVQSIARFFTSIPSSWKRDCTTFQDQNISIGPFTKKFDSLDVFHVSLMLIFKIKRYRRMIPSHVIEGILLQMYFSLLEWWISVNMKFWLSQHSNFRNNVSILWSHQWGCLVMQSSATFPFLLLSVSISFSEYLNP